jgi:hypothetical protein
MNYKVEKGTEKHVHLEIVKAEFNATTGLPKFKSFPQIFTEKEYKNFLAYPNGHTILKVLHLPEGVKTVDELREESKANKKASRVNIVEIAEGRIKSMYEDAKPSKEPVKIVPEDNSEEIELEDMDKMSRAEMDEYASKFDIDGKDYSNKEKLQEAIEAAIEELS